MQLEVLLKILTPSLSNRKVLNIAHTGGGKMHIIRVLGTYARAVHLVIHPILALTADQVLKFMEGTDKYGAIDAHNMDASPKALRKQIIAKMGRLVGDITTTLFIFVSPQTLAGDKSFLDAVIKCARSGTLRSVVTDEAHLLAVQGASFRMEIRKLRKVFWDVVLSQQFSPLVLVMTGTMSQRNLTTFTKLTSLDFPPESTQWETSNDFEQRYLSMDLIISSKYTTHLNLVATFLCDRENDAAFVW